MPGKKAQVATEYLLLTGFILTVIAILFAYSYITNSQNIKINKANNTLDKLINAADLVYAQGPGNIQMPEILLPGDITLVQDIAICNNGENEHAGLGEEACDGPGQNGVRTGAIEIQFTVFGGNTKISRASKAEIELDTGASFPTKEGVYRIKTYWCDASQNQKICLEQA